MNAPAIVTRCARRATRIVTGGRDYLAAAKVAAHRRARRAEREAVRVGDYDFVAEVRVTGHDVA